jgi:RNA polymerase sigma-70 factor (sigma-E family)
VSSGNQSALGPPGSAETDWLEVIYGSHRAALLRLARLLTGSDSAAEDVVHDAFVRVQRTGRRPDDPRAYLRRTVVNLCHNRTRRLRLERRSVTPVPPAVSNPEIDETWSAIRRLPFRQRAVVILRFYEDLPEADIAKVLGCAPGTVKSSLHRALARVRKEIADD